LKVFQKVETVADVVLLDGQGIAHPRRMGIASHVGLFLELPTIGCAKSRLVGKFEPVPEQKGSYSVLKVDDERVGWVVRTRDGVKPIFVSPGHRIGLERTLKVVMECCGIFRIPEPLRRAHQLVNRLRKGSFFSYI
jgi:deoxyribonuclease V